MTFRLRAGLAALLFLGIAAFGACGDDQNTCQTDDDCASDERCVSLDPNPNDSNVYLKSCRPICSPLFADECSSSCCIQAEGAYVCAPRSYCN